MRISTNGLLKWVVFKACLILFVCLIPYQPLQAQSQNEDDYFYVVIGAFASPRNAIDWTEKAKRKNYDAAYAFNPNRNLNYVYIKRAEDKSSAVQLAVKLQTETEYTDAWVYQGLLGDHPRRVKIEPEERKVAIEEIKKEEEAAGEPIEQNKPDEVIAADDGSKLFYFKLISEATGKEVIGDVDIYNADLAKSRKQASYRANDDVSVKPVNKSGNLMVVCDVFGYRKLEIPVNFNNPIIGDGVSVEDGKIVLTFNLVRLKKGDKVIMYNVYFFKDAAIMRPESRFEVNALLDFMKENPNRKIRIHGHTNGNGAGKIISMGSSTDYFGLTKDNKDGSGSAMKLSEERARVMQSYLVTEGIDKKRMELKAWGGKNAIYDEEHPSAAANVRVEIEVLEE